MTTPETARAAFRRLLVLPWRPIREGTFYGHVIAGRSCADGHRGLVAKTGADQSLFFRMLGAGWGDGAALATYAGAHLVSPPMRRRIWCRSTGSTPAIWRS